MRQQTRSLWALMSLVLLALSIAPAAMAQTPAPEPPPSPPAAAADVRPATTTFMGDTGLWYVPTAEILSARKWSVSGYRVNFDDNQGFTDVSNWPVTFAYGVRYWAELFGSFVVVNRIDRDVRPLFLASASGAQAHTVNRQVGGFAPQHPLARAGWSGNNIGDFWLGAKGSIASQWRHRPVSVAIRAMVKAPTGDTGSGAGTGKVDVALDAIVSREINQRVELSGYGGFIVRGAPDEVEETNGVRWGIGAGFPARKALRLSAEIDGEAYTKTTLATKTLLLGADGSFAPAGFAYDMKSPINVNLGLTWQHRNGFFAGAGWTWRPTVDARSEFLSQYTNGAGDRMDVVGRIGYHPGVRVYAPPPPSAPPPPPSVAQNRPPMVRAQCEPCTVYVGKTSRVTADAQDPDGDPLTYTWSAPAGSLTAASARQTPWTAPMVEGPVPISVRVEEGKGGTASDVITMQVIKEAVKQVVFEDVHFDFDRYSLRPEATRALDEAIRALQEAPGLRITVEGHTCNIGTAEYNLALGERRSNAVREYLSSRGVGATRLQTVSYGEERPTFDNAREETRRLNRRAALVVRVQ